MKIKFCPKCRGTEIEDVTEQINNSLLSHYSAPRIFKCKKCGFENQLFPEVDSKEELKKLIDALKNKNNKKSKKPMEENKFVEPGIALEKISPVLKPVANTREGLEQITSPFVLQKNPEEKEKPYESEKQKYLSQSSEYKTFVQTESLQTPTEVQKNITHMGVEQSTKRKSERFFNEKSEKEYKHFMYDKSEKM